MKICYLLITFLLATAASAQKLTYTPEHPKAGDVITITYEPAGGVKTVEGFYYPFPMKVETYTNDIVLTINSGQYTGTIRTDSSDNLLYLGFYTDRQLDNNKGEGYFILLSDATGNVKKGAYAQLALCNAGRAQFQSEIGMERPEIDNKKAAALIKKEMDMFPEERKNYLTTYINLLALANKEEAQKVVMKEIEDWLKQGLKTEKDYTDVEWMYRYAGFPEQAKLISSVKKERFPTGRWSIDTAYRVFLNKMKLGTDPLVAAREVIEKIKSFADADNNFTLKLTRNNVLENYVQKKDWDGLKKALAAFEIEKDDFINFTIARALVKAGAEPDLAEQLSRPLAEYAKKYLDDSRVRKCHRISIYCRYTDVYAQALYHKGQYKQAMEVAREVMKIDGMKQLAYVDTYAMIAEKVLSKDQYLKELEQFVKDGQSTEQIIECLRARYISSKGNDQGFQEYITALQTESYRKLKEEYRKKMMNQPAPQFALLDLDGKTVKMSELKGKTVVLDFWATWCTPCKASFPGMQKLVNKYKDNPDVKFLFIDIREKKGATVEQVAQFIADNKYTFHVLLDNDNKVFNQFKLIGVPTKFVIDPSGVIRFKSVGFEGSNDNLVKELSTMIDVASEQTHNTL